MSGAGGRSRRSSPVAPDGPARSAATARRSEDQTWEVLKMSPTEALAELEQYVRWSAEKRAFGKTRAQAAIRVLDGHLGR